jgi:ribonuclease HII
MKTTDGTMPLFPPEETSFLYHESRALDKGFRFIAGVDEVGRGPLAGPVVAAAVVFPQDFQLPDLLESKQLSAPKREYFFGLIRKQALAIGLGMVHARQVDEINILQATLKAMAEAVQRLKKPADYLLVDGIFKVPCPLEQKTIKKGDNLSHSIAAASVIAKVVRDRIMTAYDQRFPGYGFASNKGYGSAAHLAALARQGPSPVHRLSFKGVREHVKAHDE